MGKSVAKEIEDSLPKNFQIKWFLHDRLCCSSNRMLCCDMTKFEKHKHKLEEIADQEFEITNLMMEKRVARSPNCKNSQHISFKMQIDEETK
jgi:hypothetical protein